LELLVPHGFGGAQHGSQSAPAQELEECAELRRRGPDRAVEERLDEILDSLGSADLVQDGARLPNALFVENAGGRLQQLELVEDDGGLPESAAA
jgi:hypothetical protein